MTLKATFSLFLGLLLVQPAVAAEPSADLGSQGRWKEHEISFTYSGFTSKYSCDGLADKVRLLLRTLGARPDLKVATYGCGDLFGGPTEFPRVKLRFATLEPATEGVTALPAESAVQQPAAVPQPYGHSIGREAPRVFLVQDDPSVGHPQRGVAHTSAPSFSRASASSAAAFTEASRLCSFCSLFIGIACCCIISMCICCISICC
jgi:hypothetical protein